MRKCVVNVSRLGLTVLEGSVVYVDEAQYESIKPYVTEAEEKAVVSEQIAETPEKPKRKKSTKA